MNFSMDNMDTYIIPNIRKTLRTRWLIHVNKTHPDIVKKQPDYSLHSFYLFSINDLVSVQPMMNNMTWTDAKCWLNTYEMNFNFLAPLPKISIRKLWLNFVYTKCPNIVKKQEDFDCVRLSDYSVTVDMTGQI